MIRTIILLIILAVFNAVFFLSGAANDLTQEQWITYGFINFGIASPFILSMIPMNKPEIKTSLVSIGIVYGVLEFIAGIILLACNITESIWPIIGQIIMLAIALVLCLGMYSIDIRKNL